METKFQDGTLEITVSIPRFQQDDAEFIAWKNESMREAIIHEMAKHMHDGMEYVIRMGREFTPPNPAPGPWQGERTIRHYVDVFEAAKLIQRNRELQHRIDALERQNAALLIVTPIR